MTKMLHSKIMFRMKAVDKENGIIRGVFSTGAEDRHGEIVDQSGWKLDEFMQNPVVLFAHDHYQPAVGKVIELGTGGQQLEGAIQFAVNEYPFAATLFNLYAGQFMRAFSVGFRNEVYEIDQENDMVILKENTLLEISCVNVPANAEALALAKGIDTEPLHDLTAGKYRIEEKKEVPEAKKDEKGLSTNQVERIRSAIGALTDALKAETEPDTRSGEEVAEKGRTPHAIVGGKKQVSVKVLNRAIRELLAAKRGS